jgi:hypothetical protein
MNGRLLRENAWKLSGTLAELHRGDFSAVVDVARPDLGLRQLCVNDRDVSGNLLAVARDAEDTAATSQWPLTLADSYIRGDDLVATYEPTNDWPFAPQIYWRAEPIDADDEVIASLSLLVSVQTHLLDTWPRIAVTSDLLHQELLDINPLTKTTRPIPASHRIRPTTPECCVLRRMTELPMSYIEVMPASDFRELRARPTASGSDQAEWRLFAEFLEKGVIRRAGMLIAFVRRETDVLTAVECCAAMEHRALPLTT